jgi:hypothetical protein
MLEQMRARLGQQGVGGMAGGGNIQGSRSDPSQMGPMSGGIQDLIARMRGGMAGQGGQQMPQAPSQGLWNPQRPQGPPVMGDNNMGMPPPPPGGYPQWDNRQGMPISQVPGWNPTFSPTGPSMAPTGGTPQVNPQMPTNPVVRPQQPRTVQTGGGTATGDPRPPSPTGGFNPTPVRAPTQVQQPTTQPRTTLQSKYGSLSGVRR